MPRPTTGLRALIALVLLAPTGSSGPGAGPPARVWLRGEQRPEVVAVRGLYLFTDVHTAQSPVAEYLRGRVERAWRRFDFDGLAGFDVLAWEDRRRARVRFSPREGEPVVAEEVLLAPLGGIWADRTGRLKVHGSRIYAVRFAPFSLESPAPPPPLPIALDKPGTPVRTRIREKDGAAMVWVPAGPFVMGHEEPGPPAPEYDDARPAHRVDLPAFWLDRTEVTAEGWARFLRDRGSPVPEQIEQDARARLPIGGVSWEGAREYCAWAGGRLPTEAEWEKASRGGSSGDGVEEGREFPWGDVLPGEGGNWRANVRTLDPAADRHEGPARVGSYPGGAGPYGALDQAGNLREWTADLYGPYGGPPEGGERVVRGGSYLDREDYVRSWFRFSADPDQGRPNIGLRCAADARAPEAR